MKRTVPALTALFLLAMITTASIQPQDIPGGDHDFPHLSQPTLTARCENGAVHLSWNAVRNATEYEAWVWVNGGWIPLTSLGHTSTTVVHASPVPGAWHWYAVRGVQNQAGDHELDGLWSEYLEVVGPYNQDCATSPTFAPTATPTPTFTPTPVPTRPPPTQPTGGPPPIPREPDCETPTPEG